jgi:hypothetical protein
MTPDGLIEWATCIGVAWLIFASLTDADQWLKSLFGRKDKERDLEERVAELEKRLKQVEKQ